jgi:hypothetical protein
MKAMLKNSLVILIAGWTWAGATAAESDPETVLVTYHVKAGKAIELAKLIDRTWATYRRLDLVFDKPHLVMRGKNDSGEFIAEILPWKSHSAPDHAPAEVKALWDQMEVLCERRGDSDTIEIPEVEVLRNDT